MVQGIHTNKHLAKDSFHDGLQMQESSQKAYYDSDVHAGTAHPRNTGQEDFGRRTHSELQKLHN